VEKTSLGIWPSMMRLQASICVKRCNKIIHAQEIRAVYDDAVQFRGDEVVSRRWYCDGEVELKGTQGKKIWQASVHVFNFLETVLTVSSSRFSLKSRKLSDPSGDRM
jgi:hypothetical protein